MQNVTEFINSFVKIEFIEKSNGFGHYPFQMSIENKDGSKELHSLCCNYTCVSDYFRHFKNAQNENVKTIFMSLDFPATDDIEHDFAVVFCYENGFISLVAIPYRVEDGYTFEVVKNKKALGKIYLDYIKVVGS